MNGMARSRVGEGRRWLAAALALGLCAAGCSRPTPGGAGAREVAGEAVPEGVDFNGAVRPLLNANCTSCHGGVKQAGGLSFVYRDRALAVQKSGRAAIVPGDPANSELLARVRSSDPEVRMPPPDHGKALAPEQIALLERWVKTGAPWEEHWAFVPPARAHPPAVSDPAWCRNDIDRFVLARLDAMGLAPAPEAPRARLLRRLSLDLTGLPPTPEEASAFESDPSPGAYEKAVDRLLASPRFGERWASMWLDVARYADTDGFEKDSHRDIWAYRDWVIRAFNANLPYDQFVTVQLAGDLLPNAGPDAWIATAFHRNTKTNVEGGTDDEEYRVAAVIDRVNTTWQAFMGTTFGCVQCHDHPYDPFPHEDYYRFKAFFNSTADHDTRDHFPVRKVALDDKRRLELFQLENALAEAEREFMAPFQVLASRAEWRDLDYREAASTDKTRLSIRDLGDGRRMLATGPDTPAGSIHTVAGHAPVRRVDAVRIDALMQEGKSAASPGDPFVVSYLECAVRDAKGRETPRALALGIADIAGDPLWPMASLDAKSKEGWGCYPKQGHPRWAVFLPAEPISLRQGEQLVFRIHHKFNHDGAQQPILRRFTIRVDSDPRWGEAAARNRAAELLARRDTLLAEIKKIPATQVPVMRELPAALARETRVFRRGNWLDLGEAVAPGVPGVLHPFPGGAPADRLGLARWITDAKGPLTARVAVNRFWEQLFGLGLVETLEDFGSPGTPPSHPELLDHLAARFAGDMRWDMKALLREIVLSATYRQAAVATPEKRDKDPRNRFLSRGPRQRLTAEMVRDQALAVAGLLSTKMHGPPVMPPQPEGVWRSARSNAKWVESKGEDRHRRAVYTYWKRLSPYPSFVTFDAPLREVCSMRRVPTNTPLQALVTLNDPVYIECAQALAKRMAPDDARPTRDAIGAGLRLATAEAPDPADVDTLMALYEDSAAMYRNLAADALALGATPERAALVVVAAAILNLDRVMVR